MDTGFVVTSFGHACVRLEKAGQRLVLDPGGWSDMRALESADAIVITHEHADHWQAEPIIAAMEANAELRVWAPPVVAESLAAAGAPRDRVIQPEDGVAFEAAGFSLTPTVTKHAMIHPEIPIITNVAYVIDGVVLHPGDCLTVEPEGLDVLLLPLTAPWSKVMETIEYARRVGAQRYVPIHDGVLSEIGRNLYDSLVSARIPKGAEYLRLAVGESITVG